MVERAGYVLVGGESSRMGRDKAWLDWGGRPLAAAVAEAVERAAGSVKFVGDPARHAGLGRPTIPDPAARQGPAAGLTAALEDSPARLTLVVACDLPRLTPEFLETLFAVGDADARIPAQSDGRLQPLCAVYRAGAAAIVRAAFERGERKLLRVLDGLRVETVPVPDPALLTNVNTPADWAAFGAE